MMKKSLTAVAIAALMAGAAFGIASCASISGETREVTAERIARPAFMVERKIDANGMKFQLWERAHRRGEPANIYIEGDGHTASKGDFYTLDSSPSNPLALNLASRDKAKNLIYIARPCQFMESPDETCGSALWQNRRFSPEVIAAFNDVIDDVKKRWDITDINLIGYDGGANIAAAIAAARTDVASLRTVAGILNPQMVYKPVVKDKIETPALDSDSVLAKDLAPNLANLPQHHFIGGGDTYVPAGVYHTYRQAMGESDCVHYTFVPDADHESGWVEKWPELLNLTVSCQGAANADGEIFTPSTPLPPVPTVLEKP